MTRVTFDSREEFMKWLGDRKRPYEVYVDVARIYAIPTVSTRPVVYGILDETDPGLVSKMRDMDLENIYTIESLSFDDTRAERGSDRDG